MTQPPYARFQAKLLTYHRDPVLTPEELTAAVAFPIGECRTRHTRLKKSQQSLSRLIQPIADVLDLMGIEKTQTRNNVLESIIRGIAHYQTAYWNWSDTQWEDWLHQLEIQEVADFTRRVRFYIVSVAYLLGGYDHLWRTKHLKYRFMADRLFGAETVMSVFETVAEHLTRIGYGEQFDRTTLQTTLCLLMLVHRTSDVKAFHGEVLETLYLDPCLAAYMRPMLERISYALFGMAILARPVTSERMVPRISAALQGVPPAWADWCQRWRETSTCSPATRYRRYYTLLQVGRWLAQCYPDVTSPEQWTRDIAAAYMAAVDRMHRGQYALAERHYDPDTPLSANAKKNMIAAVKALFLDCQEWEWIKRRFDAHRSFRVASHITAATKTPPRVLPDDIWAKLIWAGLNLTEADLEPYNFTRDSLTPMPIYPTEMIQALVRVWLFAGLRSDEIRRLRVGCIRWQPSHTAESESAVCLLEVPAHKTGPSFTKPVDGLVGRAVEAWERLRPELPPMPDPKTGERVHYLFVYRARRLGRHYINEVLIPILCKKAGIPLEEARGKITSHRARSTIATQLFNARDPMSLFELQAWLGHRSPESTQRYVKLTPTRLAQAYTDAEYFKRNLRRIDVLIDQDAILNGSAAVGEPWKFYDLGHGYCTYDFFDQCPHRMACARCDFYHPKDSSQAQLLEAKSNLQHMLQEIPLTDEECTAVEDGLDAIARLMEKLIDIPTPSGQTPRQLTSGSGFVALNDITIRPQS